MSAYFDSKDIGSSLLATFIDHPDKAGREVKPTGFMEMGRMYEDLIEQEVTGSTLFTDKYFRSDIDLSANCAAWKTILPIMEADEVDPAEIEKAYIWTKKDKKGQRRLNATHGKLHDALDDIKANGFKRLIPACMGRSLDAMLVNFKRAKLDGTNLFDILRSLGAKFQVEHFWENENGAKCRMKSDIELFWMVGDQKHGMCIDLKATSKWSQFIQNWKRSYIWQYVHYSAGFERYCRENFITPHPMLYLVAESSAPWLVNTWELSEEDAAFLTPKYNQSLAECQAWIDAGRPVKGYREKRVVNRFGSRVNKNF